MTDKQKIVPTQEQIDIIHSAKAGDSLKLKAIAGASKTTTLVMVAEAIVAPILYLTFNKAMADEAKEKFPSWVEVRTTHSLAYQAIGHQYRDKLSRPVGKYQNVCGTASEVARFFKIKPIEYEDGKWITSAAIGYAILSTVRAFESSGDDKIGERHVSQYALTRAGKQVGHIKERYENVVLKSAKSLWELRINLKSKVLAEHDTYLKLYQLSNPDLSEYQVLMVDEFQDTSDAVVSIIKEQSIQTIIVGDPGQAIYQFRGAINALDKFDYKELSLSKSFRYGQEVADVAKGIMGRTDMFGWEKVDTKVFGRDEDTGDMAPYTAIYRTNSAMLQDAVQSLSEGKEVNIEADIRGFVSLIDSALALHQGNMKKVKHHSLLVYEDWNSLVKDVEWVSGELNRVVGMIKDKSVYSILGVLRSHKNVDNPDIIFSTAHKMKGLERDYVVLGDDFMSIYDKGGNVREIPTSERNLLYVAATRASRVLVLNEQIEEILSQGVKSNQGLEVRVNRIAIMDALVTGNEHKIGKLLENKIDTQMHQFGFKPTSLEEFVLDEDDLEETHGEIVTGGR